MYSQDVPRGHVEVVRYGLRRQGPTTCSTSMPAITTTNAASAAIQRGRERAAAPPPPPIQSPTRPR